jgi:hypothetical protein
MTCPSMTGGADAQPAMSAKDVAAAKREGRNMEEFPFRMRSLRALPVGPAKRLTGNVSQMSVS